jgi:hypothetical protein
MNALKVDHVTECTTSKLSWNAIAISHGILSKTLYGWRELVQFVEPLHAAAHEDVLPIVVNVCMQSSVFWGNEHCISKYRKKSRM